MKGDKSRPALLYLVTNIVNGKRYIGVTTQTARRRMIEHVCHANKRRHEGAFYRALRKHGRASFKIEILAQYATAHEALLAEVEYVSLYKPEYNSTVGGEAGNGGHLTLAGRRKIGDVSRGNKYFLGKKHSPETRALLSQRASERIELFRQYTAMGPAAMARAVRCLDDGSEWPSASAAARYFDIAKSALIEVCLKRPYRKTAGGRRFEYVEA